MDATDAGAALDGAAGGAGGVWRRVAAGAGSPRWLLVRGLAQTAPRLAALVAALALVSGLLPAALTLATGLLVGTLAQAQAGALGAAAGERVALAVAVLGALFVLDQVLDPLLSVAADALGRRHMAAVYRRIMRASLRPRTLLHLETPDLLDRIKQAQNEGWAGPRAATNGLVGWATRRLGGVVALLIVARFSWWLALLLGAAQLWHLTRAQRLHRAMIEESFVRTPALRLADYYADTLTLPAVAKEVRLFELAGWLATRFEESWLGAMGELWRRRRGVAPRTAQALLPLVAVEALGLWLVGQAAAAGAIGLGALVVYATAIFQSFALGEVARTELMVEYGTSGLKPLAALEHAVASDPRLALPGRLPADGLPREAVRFEGVRFRYPGWEADVFGGLDLEIPAGRSLAIVGDNGAGKTTLIKLLCRLYDPCAGRITVDGTDLRDLDAAAWQRQVAAIFQDFQRYELSAYDNVALGAMEHQGDRAAVVAAARRAGALDLIEALPRGWDTVLSARYSGGVDVSGGQWQRIALARALFAAASGAPVLVLDEPTAQLDVRAEAAFYDAFLELTRGLTTIVVSHRFSTVRRADTIVVLDAQGAAEAGSHAELVARGGRYAALFALQAQRYTEEAAG